MPQNGLKMGSCQPFVHPKWSRMRFGKMRFRPIFDPFLPQSSASSRHFGIFGGPKWATTGSKQPKNTCFSMTHGRGSLLRKVIFPPLLDPVDPFGHPPVWAWACSWLQPSGPGYGGLGVHSGNSEGWKPQKVGGCGWSRCPRNRVLSHVAKDMGYSWFVAVASHLHKIWGFWGPFWAVSATYGGVRGPQRAR